MSDLNLRTLLPWLTASMISMPVLYVASSGPVYRLSYPLAGNHPAMVAINFIYDPLWAACKHSEVAAEFLELYAGPFPPLPPIMLQVHGNAISCSIPAEEPISDESDEIEDPPLTPCL